MISIPKVHTCSFCPKDEWYVVPPSLKPVSDPKAGTSESTPNYQDELRRIAKALERIADTLEEKNQ